MSGDKKHIYIGNASQKSVNYNARPGRGASVDLTMKNATQQGLSLQSQLMQSTSTYQQIESKLDLQVRDISLNEGIYLTIKSDLGAELDVSKFNNKNISLRSIKAENNQEVVTLYLFDKNAEKLQRKITDYLTKETTSKKPKNQPMLNNIDAIKPASFEDFWNDDLNLLPVDREQSNYFELWLKNDPTLMDGEANRLRNICQTLDITLSQNSIKLHETHIFKAYGSVSNLEKLIYFLPNIIEFRSPSETPKVYVKMETADQIEFNEELQSRISLSPDAENFLVAVIDTGVNYNNLLLKKITNQSFSVKYSSNWQDYTEPLAKRYDYHGSMQAGICGFGSNLPDLLRTTSPILCTHMIESGRILPPFPQQNNQDLYGYVTTDTANKLIIDRPNAKRVFSMAVTSSVKQDGYPTSWSSAIDNFCINVDGGFSGNLFVISAGNAEYPNINYWENARNCKVQDPAQAWNAITVGSCTNLYNITDIVNARIVSKVGDINPTTTSSLNWDWAKGPIKPEILCEGGNYHILPDGTVDSHEDLSILTASGKTLGSVFDTNSDTSAATAQASFIAAKILSAYPDYNPQTIRGILVHWAEWTKPIQDELTNLRSTGVAEQESKRQILRVCGYGIPNIEKSINSKNNRLTLIVESSIRPFDDNFSLNEFNLHDLPWPEATLKSLPGDIPVRLTVTLSYFIEPNPRIERIRSKYVYRSHGLTFNLIKPTQTVKNFVESQNRPDSRSEDFEETGQDYGWYFKSNLRNLGSIHKDIWEGTASDLAEMSKIIVKPVTGWWKLNKDTERCHHNIDYSLIVSIEVENNQVDIYSEVLNKVSATNPSLVSITVPTTP